MKRSDSDKSLPKSTMPLKLNVFVPEPDQLNQVVPSQIKPTKKIRSVQTLETLKLKQKELISAVALNKPCTHFNILKEEKSTFPHLSKNLPRSVKTQTQSQSNQQISIEDTRKPFVFIHRRKTKDVRNKLHIGFSPKVDNYANALYISEAINECDSRTSNGVFIKVLKIFEWVISVLSWWSFVFALIEIEIGLRLNIKIRYGNTQLPHVEIIELFRQRKLSKWEQMFRVFNMLITLTSLVIHIGKWIYKFKYKFTYNTKKPNNTSKNISLVNNPVNPDGKEIPTNLVNKSYFISDEKTNHFKWKFIFEFIILGICNPPASNVVYTIQRKNKIYPIFLSHIVFVFTCFKLYFIIPWIKNYSKWNTKIAKAILRNYKMKTSYSFILGVLIHKNPFITLLLFLIFNCFFFGLIIQWFEFGFYDSGGIDFVNFIHNWDNYMNNVWMLVMITFNISYGDFFPKTFIGGFFIFWCSVFNIASMSLIVIKTISLTLWTKDEKRVYLKLQKWFDPENEQHKAANVIKGIWNWRMTKIKQEKGMCAKSKKYVALEVFFILVNLRKDIKKLKDSYKISSLYSIPVHDLLKTMEDKWDEDARVFNNYLNKMNCIDNDFDEIIEGQSSVMKDLSVIKANQNNIGDYWMNYNNYIFVNKPKKNNDKNKRTNLKWTRSWLSKKKTAPIEIWGTKPKCFSPDAMKRSSMHKIRMNQPNIGRTEIELFKINSSP